MAQIHSPARPARLCRHALILFALAGCVTAAVRPAGAQNATTGEVKAAFLFNFARFTEFPEGAFSSPTAPFVIGIADDDTMRRSLDLVVGGKLVGKRAVLVRDVKGAKDLEDLHMLFIGGESGVTDRLKQLAGRPVLTVGDANRFCDLGGMIMFALENNRVRFEIRLDATEQAQLKVSSRVLSLAKAIHGKN